MLAIHHQMLLTSRHAASIGGDREGNVDGVNERHDDLLDALRTESIHRREFEEVELGRFVSMCAELEWGAMVMPEEYGWWWGALKRWHAVKFLVR